MPYGVNAGAPLNLPAPAAVDGNAPQRLNPILVANHMRGNLANREAALAQSVAALNNNPTMADLMRLQVEMKRFTQTFEMTSSTAKTLHDAHSTIIRNI